MKFSVNRKQEKLLKVLVIKDYHLPGFRAGGPIQTVANLVEQLGDHIEFLIVTRDRDLKDSKSYTSVQKNTWQRVGKGLVYYVSDGKCSFRSFLKLLNEISYDIIYLNSFFSFDFTIKPLLLRFFRFLPGVPVILAPRGEFSKGALSIKRVKKLIYINIAKVMGLYRKIIWQACSDHEAEDIRTCFGEKIMVHVVPNLGPVKVFPSIAKREMIKKQSGYLRVAFLSRISKMKNLDEALRILKGVSGRIEFNIYGPIENVAYWNDCQRIINTLPVTIEVNYGGPIPHDQVVEVLGSHDLFFLPTLGENFGHVILEAFIAGCPVLISDKTPWRNLEKHKVGWDLPLSNYQDFQKVLRRCIDMSEEEHQKMKRNAMKYGRSVSANRIGIEKNMELFFKTVEKG